MKNFNTTTAWIILCLISAVLYVNAEHTLSFNNGLLDLQTNTRLKHQNIALPIGVQMPEQVLSTQNLSCISSDENIFEIMNKARETCRGTDIRCTFYHFVDHKYNNLGTLDIDKELFNNLLMKYDHWLLTAKNIETNDSFIDHNPKINKYDHNMNLNETKSKVNTHYMAKPLEKHKQHHRNKESTARPIFHEKKMRNGNYIKLHPEFNKDHECFEVILPKDKENGYPRTFYVDINKDNNELLFFDEGIDTELNENKPVNVELKQFTTIADDYSQHKDNITKSLIHTQNIQNDNFYYDQSDTCGPIDTNSVINENKIKVNEEKFTQDNLEPPVFSSNINNINANQNTITDDTTVNVNSIVNTENNLVVANSNINQIQFYEDSELNNYDFKKPIDHILINDFKLPKCNNKVSDTKAFEIYEEGPLDGNNEHIKLDNSLPKHIGNYGLSGDSENLMVDDDSTIINIVENANTHFDDTHDTSYSRTCNTVHLNEPIFEIEKPLYNKENNKKSSPYVFKLPEIISHPTAGESEYAGSQIEPCSEIQPLLKDMSSVPNVPLTSFNTVPLLGKESANALEAESLLHPSSSYPAFATLEPSGASQNTLSNSDSRPIVSDTCEYASPILPSPVESVIRLDSGYSPSNAGFARLSFQQQLPTSLQGPSLPLPVPCKEFTVGRPEYSSPHYTIPVEDTTLLKDVPFSGVSVNKPSFNTSPCSLESTTKRPNYMNFEIPSNPPMIELPSSIMTPDRVQQNQVFTQPFSQLAKSNLMDLDQVKYTPFEFSGKPLPVYNPRDIMMPPPGSIFRNPYITFPQYANPYLDQLLQGNHKIPAPLIQLHDPNPYQDGKFLWEPKPSPPNLLSPLNCLWPGRGLLPNPLTYPNPLNMFPNYINPYLAPPVFPPTDVNPGIQCQQQKVFEPIPCPYAKQPYLTNSNLGISQPSELFLPTHTPPCQSSKPSLDHDLTSIPCSIPNFIKKECLDKQHQAGLVPSEVPVKKPASQLSFQNQSPNSILDSSLIGPHLCTVCNNANNDDNQSINRELPIEPALSNVILLDTTLKGPKLDLEKPPLMLNSNNLHKKPCASHPKVQFPSSAKVEPQICQNKPSNIVLDTSLIGPHLTTPIPTKNDELLSEYNCNNVVLDPSLTEAGIDLETSSVVLDSINTQNNVCPYPEAPVALQTPVVLDSTLIGPHLLTLSDSNDPCDEIKITIDELPLEYGHDTFIPLDPSLIGPHIPIPTINKNILPESDLTNVPLESSLIDNQLNFVDELEQLGISEYENPVLPVSAAVPGPDSCKTTESLPSIVIGDDIPLDTNVANLIPLDTSLIGPPLEIGNLPLAKNTIKHKMLLDQPEDGFLNKDDNVAELKYSILPTSLLPPSLGIPAHTDFNLQPITQEPKMNKELLEIPPILEIHTPELISPVLDSEGHLEKYLTGPSLYHKIEPLDILTPGSELDCSLIGPSSQKEIETPESSLIGPIHQQIEPLEISPTLDNVIILDSSLMGPTLQKEKVTPEISLALDPENKFESSLIGPSLPKDTVPVEVPPILSATMIGPSLHQEIELSEIPSVDTGIVLDSPLTVPCLPKEIVTPIIDCERKLDSSLIGPSLLQDIALVIPTVTESGNILDTTLKGPSLDQEIPTVLESGTVLDTTLQGPSLHQDIPNILEPGTVLDTTLKRPPLLEEIVSPVSDPEAQFENTFVIPSFYQEIKPSEIIPALETGSVLDNYLIGPDLPTFSKTNPLLISEEFLSDEALADLLTSDSFLIDTMEDYENQIESPVILLYEKPELYLPSASNSQICKPIEQLPSDLIGEGLPVTSVSSIYTHPSKKPIAAVNPSVSSFTPDSSPSQVLPTSLLPPSFSSSSMPCSSLPDNAMPLPHVPKTQEIPLLSNDILPSDSIVCNTNNIPYSSYLLPTKPVCNNSLLDKPIALQSNIPLLKTPDQNSLPSSIPSLEFITQSNNLPSHLLKSKLQPLSPCDLLDKLQSPILSSPNLESFAPLTFESPTSPLLQLPQSKILPQYYFPPYVNPYAAAYSWLPSTPVPQYNIPKPPSPAAISKPPPYQPFQINPIDNLLVPTAETSDSINPLSVNTDLQTLTLNTLLNTPLSLQDDKAVEYRPFTLMSPGQGQEYSPVDDIINEHPCVKSDAFPYLPMEREPYFNDISWDIASYPLQNNDLSSLPDMPPATFNFQSLKPNYLPSDDTKPCPNEDFYNNLSFGSDIPMSSVSPFIQNKPNLNQNWQPLQDFPIASNIQKIFQPTFASRPVSSVLANAHAPFSPLLPTTDPKLLLDTASQSIPYPQLNISPTEYNQISLDDITSLLDEDSIQMLKDMSTFPFTQSPVTPFDSQKFYNDDNFAQPDNFASVKPLVPNIPQYYSPEYSLPMEDATKLIPNSQSVQRLCNNNLPIDNNLLQSGPQNNLMPLSYDMSSLPKTFSSQYDVLESPKTNLIQDSTPLRPSPILSTDFINTKPLPSSPIKPYTNPQTGLPFMSQRPLSPQYNLHPYSNSPLDTQLFELFLSDPQFSSLLDSPQASYDDSKITHPCHVSPKPILDDASRILSPICTQSLQPPTSPPVYSKPILDYDTATHYGTMPTNSQWQNPDLFVFDIIPDLNPEFTFSEPCLRPPAPNLFMDTIPQLPTASKEPYYSSPCSLSPVHFTPPTPVFTTSLSNADTTPMLPIYSPVSSTRPISTLNTNPLSSIYPKAVSPLLQDFSNSLIPLKISPLSNYQGLPTTVYPRPFLSAEQSPIYTSPSYMTKPIQAMLSPQPPAYSHLIPPTVLSNIDSSAFFNPFTPVLTNFGPLSYASPISPLYSYPFLTSPPFTKEPVNQNGLPLIRNPNFPCQIPLPLTSSPSNLTPQLMNPKSQSNLHPISNAINPCSKTNKRPPISHIEYPTQVSKSLPISSSPINTNSQKNIPSEDILEAYLESLNSDTSMEELNSYSYLNECICAYSNVDGYKFYEDPNKEFTFESLAYTLAPEEFTESLLDDLLPEDLDTSVCGTPISPLFSDPLPSLSFTKANSQSPPENMLPIPSSSTPPSSISLPSSFLSSSLLKPLVPLTPATVNTKINSEHGPNNILPIYKMPKPLQFVPLTYSAPSTEVPISLPYPSYATKMPPLPTESSRLGNIIPSQAEPYLSRLPFNLSFSPVPLDTLTKPISGTTLTPMSSTKLHPNTVPNIPKNYGLLPPTCTEKKTSPQSILPTPKTLQESLLLNEAPIHFQPYVPLELPTSNAFKSSPVTLPSAVTPCFKNIDKLVTTVFNSPPLSSGTPQYSLLKPTIYRTTSLPSSFSSYGLYNTPSLSPCYSFLPLEISPDSLVEKPCLYHHTPIYSIPNEDFKASPSKPLYSIPTNLPMSRKPCNSIILSNILKPLDISKDYLEPYTSPITSSAPLCSSSLIKPLIKSLPQKSRLQESPLDYQYVSKLPIDNVSQFLPSSSPLLESPLLKPILKNSLINTPILQNHQYKPNTNLPKNNYYFSPLDSPITGSPEVMHLASSLPMPYNFFKSPLFDKYQSPISTSANEPQFLSNGSKLSSLLNPINDTPLSLLTQTDDNDKTAWLNTSPQLTHAIPRHLPSQMLTPSPDIDVMTLESSPNQPVDENIDQADEPINVPILESLPLDLLDTATTELLYEIMPDLKDKASHLPMKHDQQQFYPTQNPSSNQLIPSHLQNPQNNNQFYMSPQEYSDLIRGLPGPQIPFNVLTTPLTVQPSLVPTNSEPKPFYYTPQLMTPQNRLQAPSVAKSLQGNTSPFGLPTIQSEVAKNYLLKSIEPVKPLTKLKMANKEYYEDFNKENEYYTPCIFESENLNLDEIPDVNVPRIVHKPPNLSKREHFYANNHVGKSPQVFNVNPIYKTTPTTIVPDSMDFTKNLPIAPEICEDLNTVRTQHFRSIPEFDTPFSRPNEYYTEMPNTPNGIYDIIQPRPKKALEPAKYTPQFNIPSNIINRLQMPEVPHHPASYTPFFKPEDIKYMGYKTYQIPSQKFPQLPQNQGICPQNHNPTASTPLSSKPMQMYQTPHDYKSTESPGFRIPQNLIPEAMTAPQQTNLALDSIQQSPDSNEYNPTANNRVCKDNKDVNKELINSLVNYINSKGVKDNLYDINDELIIPIGNIAVTKKESSNANTIETNNPSIGLKVWKSKIKLILAELKLKFKELSVNNFMPIVNNLNKYDVEEIRKIIKNYIDDKYGSHIEIDVPYTADNQYAVIKDLDRNSINNKFNLLWPTNYV